MKSRTPAKRKVRIEAQPRKIIYYPHIRVPTFGSWIRRSLLYFDELSSIVPQDYYADLSPHQKAEFPQPLQELKDLGIFKPLDPQGILKEVGRSGDLDEDFRTIPWRKFASDSSGDPLPLDFPIYREKVTFFIERALTGKNFGRRDGGLLYVNRRVGEIYLGLLARHMALNGSSITTAATDKPGLWQAISNAAPPAPAVLQLTFERLLPEPAENVPLRAIIDFRKDKRDALLSFRQVLDNAYTEALKCDTMKDVSDFLDKEAETMEKATISLGKLFKRSRMSFTLGSIDAYLKANLGTIGLGVALVAGSAVTLSALPVAAAACGVVGVGSLGAAIHIFNERRTRDEKIENSPYAYTFLAEREL